ncbi:MAG: type 1 glutamine amidotransferase [bacterium]
MKVLIIEHAPGRADSIKDIASKSSVIAQIWKPYQDDFIPDIQVYQGIIIGGGPMSVNEINKIDFFVRELLLIESALHEGKPIFGICLGAQLLTYMLGGRVGKTFWRKGFMDVVLTDEANHDLILRHISKSFPTFQHHQDEIVALPANTVVTITSNNCKVEGFRMVDQPIWAVQFHPEIGIAKAKQILGLADDKQLSLQEKAMLDRPFDKTFMSNDMIFKNFFDLLI